MNTFMLVVWIVGAKNIQRKKRKIQFINSPIVLTKLKLWYNSTIKFMFIHFIPHVHKHIFENINKILHK
jgi:hypothetical protein